jgi:hypothetical protein
MARLPINCCWRPIDGGEKPDLLASQLLEFIAIDTCSGRCLMAKIRVIRKATRSFRLGQMLFKTRTREIELQILPGATQRPVIIFAAVTGDHRSVMRSATLAFSRAARVNSITPSIARLGELPLPALGSSHSLSGQPPWISSRTRPQCAPVCCGRYDKVARDRRVSDG